MDVVATGHALSVVRGWFKDDDLGDDVLQQDDNEMSVVDLKPRPARLGLGAKYLAHNKASALMDPVERRLSHQLVRVQDCPSEPLASCKVASDGNPAQALAHKEQQQAGGPQEKEKETGKRDRQGAWGKDQPQPKQQDAAGGSSDEDETRSGAFGARESAAQQRRQQQLQMQKLQGGGAKSRRKLRNLAAATGPLR